MVQDARRVVTRRGDRDAIGPGMGSSSGLLGTGPGAPGTGFGGGRFFLVGGLVEDDDVLPGEELERGHEGKTLGNPEIRCQFIFPGKNDELTPDFPRISPMAK